MLDGEYPFFRIKSCDQNRGGDGGDGLSRNGHVALVGDQTSSILTDLNNGFTLNNY
jgi:hypothetical protein